MKTFVTHLANLAVISAMLSVAACTHYVVSYTAMELDLGFPGDSMSQDELTLVSSPWVKLDSHGCKRGGGLVAPPVVLQLVFAAGLRVELTQEPKLLSAGETLAPYKIQAVRGYVGGDRIEMYFMNKCSVLSGAELRIGDLSIEGRSVEIRPVRFRYAERQVNEVKRVPDQWWK
jgi:hypothetical protein